MSDLSNIRAAIAAILRGLPGIGQVHEYERFARDEKTFREMYQSTPGGPILGWNIRRVATTEDIIDMDDAESRQVRHTWEIRGFMSLDDATSSEKIFDGHIESIRDAFRLVDDLGGVVITCITDQIAGIQVTDSGPVMFGGVLCHACRLTLHTTNHVY